MKKSLICIAVSLMLILSLFACGTPAKEQTSPSVSEVQSTTSSQEPATAESSQETASEDPFANAPVITMKLAENSASTANISVVGKEFCKNVNDATKGTVKIEIYPDALLGDEATVVAAIEAGTLEFARVNLASLQSTMPEVGVFTLPYLYDSAEHCDRVLKSDVANEILAKCEEHGFIGLAYLPCASDADFRCFYSKSPIKSVADLAGKKIRVQETDIMINMVRALGGAATPMAFGEVFQALQTGVIDVAENPLLGYYSNGHYEVAKYFIYDRHQISPNVYIMSKKTYDSMTADQKTVFMECLNEYMQETAKRDREDTAEVLAKLKEKGCEFIEVDVSEFREACKTLYNDYPQYAEYIERINAIK